LELLEKALKRLQWPGGIFSDTNLEFRFWQKTREGYDERDQT
jgi:hypothetical protein